MVLLRPPSGNVKAPVDCRFDQLVCQSLHRPAFESIQRITAGQSNLERLLLAIVGILLVFERGYPILLPSCLV